MVQVDGTENDRIVVRGAGGINNRENVVLRGAGDSTRVLEIRHDYYTFEVRTHLRVNKKCPTMFCKGCGSQQQHNTPCIIFALGWSMKDQI